MDWGLVSTIVIVILGAIAGGLLIKLKKLGKEMSDFFSVLTQALEDDNISSEELANILKETNDVKCAALDIVKLFKR